jgi:TolB protein
MYFGGATIAPDGSRVVFAAQADHLGLYVVDPGGGRAARLPLPGAEGIVMAPTFSPDGTQIAYLDTGNSENHVWVMDADGSNAHELLANQETLVGGVSGLQWSPAGDRIAIQVRSTLSGDNAIYTFAPDGSNFTQVITAAIAPYWSPDGSQIAYTIVCDEQPDGCGSGRDRGYLGVVDADGSNVREFGFASSGPWHPGA